MSYSLEFITISLGLELFLNLKRFVPQLQAKNFCCLKEKFQCVTDCKPKILLTG